MKSYIAAAISMTSVPDLAKNLSQAEELIELAIRQGAELVTLPENFPFLGGEEEKISQAEAIATASEKFLKTVAQKYQITILGGGYPVPTTDGKVYNVASLIEPNGIEVARYEKAHLFDVNLPDGNTYQESNTVKAGMKLPSVYESKDYGNLGISVCYDLRFPHLYRDLALNGADLITVPSVFMHITGKDHWHSLLKARAIETGCYIVAPAQYGHYLNKRKSYGHSLIVSPWGKILKDAKTEKNIIITAIDKHQIEIARSKIPSLFINKKYKIE